MKSISNSQSKTRQYAVSSSDEWDSSFQGKHLHSSFACVDGWMIRRFVHHEKYQDLDVASISLLSMMYQIFIRPSALTTHVMRCSKLLTKQKSMIHHRKIISSCV